ncbi:MAG: hypothetical protein ACKOEM_00350 [Planctomycetia bacterium]
MLTDGALWRRLEDCQAVEKLTRREIDDAVLPRAGGLGLPPGADPLAALVASKRVADTLRAAVAAREQGEPDRPLACREPDPARRPARRGAREAPGRGG